MANTRRINVRDIVPDQLGNVWVGASVYIFAGGTWNLDDPPTGTAISGSVYATESSAPALTNPVATTGSQGEFDLWLSIPQQVDIVIADNSNAAIPSGGSAESFTPVRETYELYPKRPTYVAPTARHNQGVAYALGTTVKESPPIVFVDAQVGSDSYPVSLRGTWEYPYGTLGGPISDADYLDAAGAGKRRPWTVKVRGSPMNAADYSAAGPPPTYTVTPDSTFQISSQLVCPKGWTFDLGWGDLAVPVASTLVIPSNSFPNNTALFQTGQDSTLIGGLFTNTQTGGIGVKVGGQMTRVIGTACYFNQSHGFQITSFADDMRVLERIQSNDNGISGTGYGVILMSENSHSPNLVTIKESEISTNHGSGNIMLQRVSGESGGHTVIIEKNRLHGSKCKVDIQGYRDVILRGNYGEPSTQMNAPFVRIRCASGGTATTLADWTQGFKSIGNSWHGSSNDGTTQFPSTTTSGATGTGTTANNITDTSTFPTAPFLVLFQDGANTEYMWVTSYTATTLTGVRGVGRLSAAVSHAAGKNVVVCGGNHYDVDSCAGGDFADNHFGSIISYGVQAPMVLFGANTDSNFIDLRNCYKLDTRESYMGDPAIIAPNSAEVPSSSFLTDLGYVTLPATTPRNWGIYHDATSLRLLQGGQDMGSYP